ncbi:fibronectin type III domain-containing protein [Chryseolinea lacunae]|uniref:Fibronectin type III domain-containing protein n=1 Tax=Chryseolinea lacunae TaxID=2801331 RepID=A0ABS1KK88_9BACT|nr:fibronectin type III domain-containing protein [Chryseolinea lacunae]MBL0739663.1 fibronectin type III domain-containing protein [Chryseolinea lacunae]
MRKLTLLFLFLGLWSHHAFAQSYPVQSTTVLSPPYSTYLSDYAAPGAQHFATTLLLKDTRVAEYPTKLRLTIEGTGITIRTKQNFVPRQPLTLYGGVPVTVYGDELEEYFTPANLDFAGISRSQFEKSAKLPEGIYRFSVEVLDYNRGTVVSNKGVATAWVILNDPPLLNLPRNNAKAKIVDPTNMAFTWTPRHTGSPNAAFTTHYTFRLVEIWPATRSPYDAMLSQPTLFEITTDFTQLSYGPAEPALIPGRKYAWQVQAKDVDGRDLFKNQGKSEVFVFQFGDALGTPEGLYLQTANTTSLAVRWELTTAGADAVTFRARYRPKNNRSHDTWYETTSENQWATLQPLQADTEYEVQVRAEQIGQISEYCPAKVFKTALPGSNQFVCKPDSPLPPVPPGTTPPNLRADDVIKAGGFDVKITDVKASGSGFSGTGLAVVPWFKYAKVKVSFKNIGVNDQRMLSSGEIKSVWNADSKFLLTISKPTDVANAAKTGELPVNIVATETLIEITGTSIVTVTKNENGEVEIHTANGQKQTLDKGKSYSIADPMGNGYVVDKDGNITKTTADEARAAATRGDRNYDLVLRFEKGNGRFGFDAKKYDALSPLYQHLEDGTAIAWKATTASAPDVVAATLEGTGIDPKKVRFELSGVPLTPTVAQDNNYTLSVTGKAEGTQEELLALYSPGGTEKNKVLGKLNLTSYNTLDKNVVIVPVITNNQDKLPQGLSNDAIKDELNAIYSQAIAHWKVSFAPALSVALNPTFDDGNSGLLSNYTADMSKVIKAFGPLQADTYYLFLVFGPTQSGPNALGYMPRSKQAGFVFLKNHRENSKAIMRTMAHELGHGVFNLKHTFSEFPALQQNTTDNLMDYGSGTTLCKYQWDFVHDPQMALPLFEGDEDGESIASASLACINAEIKNKLKGNVFYDPAGEIIDIGSAIPHAFYSMSEEDVKLRGRLAAFKVGEVMYRVYFYPKDMRFAGYAPVGKVYDNIASFKADRFTGTTGSVANVQEVKVGSNCAYSIFKNGALVETGKMNHCKCEELPDTKPTTPTNESLTGLAGGFYTNHEKTPGIDKEVLYRVSMLIGQMGDDFYKKYLPDAETMPLTNDNLLVMEESLKSYIELQNRLYQKANLSSFEMLVTFLKTCYEEYKMQLNGEVRDIVPYCFWKKADVSPGLYYSVVDPAFNAGIVDGAWEMLVGLRDMANFVDCWMPMASVTFWLSGECQITRDKTLNFFSAMGDVVKDGAKFDAFKSTVSTQFQDYLGSLDGFLPNNRHEHGKLVFNIASLFFVGGEASAVVKGVSITEKTALAMEKLGAVISKIKLPAIVKFIPKSLKGAAVGAAMVLSVSAGSVTTELATFFPKATEFVINIADNAATAAAKVAEVTETIAANATKIEGAIAAAEKSTITLVDEAGKIATLGEGALAVTDIGSHVILSVHVGQNLQHIKAFEKATAAVIVLTTMGTLGQKAKDATCTFCTQAMTCGCFEELSIAFTNYLTTLKEICERNPENGLAICTKLKTGSFPTKPFLANASEPTTDGNHLANNKASYTGSILDTYNYLYTHHTSNDPKAPYARVDWSALTSFGKLKENVQAEVVQFSDNTKSKTLIEFCADVRDAQGFLEFINHPDNFNFVDGFLIYREAKNLSGSEQSDRLSTLQEELNELQVGNLINSTVFDKTKFWLDKAVDVAARRGKFAEGKAFEAYIASQLKNPNSKVYLDLKSKHIADLDERSIYQQVQFCLGGDCQSKGNYFVADFVFVKINRDDRGREYVDVVLADSKLNKTTGFTKNQEKGMYIEKLDIKAVSKTVKNGNQIEANPLKGNEIPQFEDRTLQGTRLNRSFFKIYGDGSSSGYRGISY